MMHRRVAHIPLYAELVNEDVRQVEKLRKKVLNEELEPHIIAKILRLNDRIAVNLTKLSRLGYDGKDISHYKTLLREYMVET